MNALQYIYTSWKNGNSTEKGYMIYSRSEGISDAECTAIKDAMQYFVPKEMNFTPTPEEIEATFPYSFAYFILPTGRGCIAQSTYLGKDYSGRFGNYIIYALVFDLQDLPCRPAEFFAEPYIKTAMTQEELDAPSPVPPLPPLHITQYGSVINDEQLSEFLFEKEEEFAQVITMILAAQDAKVPFYLNDERENLVLWAAAVDRILPQKMSKKFTFNTYIGDHESMRSARIREEGLNFHLIGVRPDANYFNYATECRSNRHMVLDFAGGHMTAGIEPNDFAKAMALSVTMNYEEINEFDEFISKTSFSEINGHLQDAYLYFRLLKWDEFTFDENNLKAILSFGKNYCHDIENSDIGSKLLVMFQENGWIPSIDAMAEIWKFTCKHADFMSYTLFELFQDTVYQYAGDAIDSCAELEEMIQKIKRETPLQYKAYLDYLNTSSSVEQLLLYLAGHKNICTNNFYIRWLLQSYSFANGLNSRQPISKLLKALLSNICKIENSEKCMVEILLSTVSNPSLFAVILQTFQSVVQSEDRIDKLCTSYVQMLDSIPERQCRAFEKMLIETSGTIILANRLFAKKISFAKKPEDEFWYLYGLYQNSKVATNEFSIDFMVSACLDSVESGAASKIALDMVGRLDLHLLTSAYVIRRLTDYVDACSMKMLIKMDSLMLQKICQIRATVDNDGLEKIRAVYAGKILEAYNAQRKRPANMLSEVAKMRITLESLERSEYEVYMKNYFNDFIELLNSSEDVAVITQIFYHKRMFADFISDYISVIKKKEKKERERWLSMIVWTCEYLIIADHNEQAAEDLYKPILRYLRTFEDDELFEIRQMLTQTVSKSQCEQLFRDVRQKSGLQEKLGSFFHRK